MENKNEKNEQLFLEMAKEVEQKNKKIWTSMWVILIVSMTAMIVGIFIATFLIPEGVSLFLTYLGICVFFLIPCYYALKLEVSIGTYVHTSVKIVVTKLFPLIQKYYNQGQKDEEAAEGGCYYIFSNEQ